MRKPWILILQAAACLFFLIFSCGNALSFSGLTVNDVTVEGLHSIKEEEFLYLLDIKPGTILDSQRLRKGIKRAFLKGIFEEISVERDESGTIRVMVTERTMIDKIKVRGNKSTKKGFIKKHLSFNEGEVLKEDTLVKEVPRLLEVLALSGFTRAQVSMSVEETGKPYRANVIVDLTEGRPDRIERFVVTGRPVSEVLGQIRLHEGDIYDQFKLREGIQRLKEHYLEEGYLKPDVKVISYTEGELTLEVETGPRLKIEFNGNKAVRDKTLREAMPFAEAGEAGEDLILEAANGIVDIYRERGYPDAQAVPILKDIDGEKRLEFYIFEGDVVHVESIAFEGVTIPEDRLKTIISTKLGKTFSRDRLDEDVQRLIEFYVSLGYKDVKIPEPDVKIVQSWVSVKIKVSEGERYVYSDVSVEGAERLPEEDLEGAIKIAAGEPYNEVDIADTRQSILRTCRSMGFPRCTVDVKRDFSEGGVAVVFFVKEGDARTFGKTVITGNRQTRPVVIRRELLYKEGEPLDPALLSKTRQNLYKLGLFRNVDIKTFQGVEDKEDVFIEVGEDNAGSVDLALGYGEYEKQRGYIDLRYSNLFGMNRQASVRAEASTLSTRYVLNYYEPRLLGLELPARAYLLRESRTEKNIDTGEVRYRIKRNTASTSIEKQITDAVKLGLTYEFSVVRTFDVQPDVVLSKEDTGTIEISSVTPSIAFDTRDNPFDPQRGIFMGLSVKTASSLLLSEADFIKGSAYGSGYLKPSRWFVVALSLRGGLAEGFSDTTQIPLVERFFLGGRNTVRGYNQDELGPKSDEGTPTGGNAFVLGNFELRWKVTDSWRFVNFIDAGNVWLEWSQVNLDELKYTAGAGIQYNTPVGPIRVDYGRKLEREEGESSGEIHFSIGHAF